MIEKNSVLILGAGASAPYGFPTGAGLKKIICDHFEDMWVKFIYDKVPSFTFEYLEGEKRLANAFVNDFKNFDHDSIDLFLDIFRDYTDIGKKAIYLNILNAETESTKKELINDWYTSLFRLMIGTPDDYFKLSKNNITIITFNYDRSLEQYLYNTFLNFTKSLTEKEKIEELKTLKIYHVYGKLAELPWENNENALHYGNPISMKQLIERKDNIKTIFERKEIAKTVDPIVDSIQNAKNIYFLGFGFARENVEILKMEKFKSVAQNIYVSDFENRSVRLETQLRGLKIWKEGLTTIVKNSGCKRVIEDYLF